MLSGAPVVTEAVTESGPQGDGDRPETEEDRLGMDGDKLGMEGDDAGIKGDEGEGVEGDVASQLSQVGVLLYIMSGCLLYWAVAVGSTQE